MINIDTDRLEAIDSEWQQIEESYQSEPYNAPTNLSKEKETMLLAFAAGKSYNPQFEYLPSPEFPTERILRFAQSLRPENSVFEDMYYATAQNELITLKAIETHSPSAITGHTSLIYGIPDNKLIDLARSILATPINSLPNDGEQDRLSAQEAALEMQRMLEKLDLKTWTAIPFFPMSAKVMVSRKEKVIKVREDATFSHWDLRRLLIHEIGVHVVRAENGRKQPIGIFARGLPGYLDTEEGLAVYSEEKAGVLETTTMRKYAGRVIAAALALSHSFNDTFYSIVNDLEPEVAFEIVARTKRGFRDTTQPGAHTKDIVYLSGYYNVSQHLKSYPRDYPDLFIGKFGLGDLKLVKDLLKEFILIHAELTPTMLLIEPEGRT